MAVDQVRQKTQQQKEHVELQEKKCTRTICFASKNSAYQVNSLIVQVVLQCLLELPDHGLHKLAPEVVVPRIQKAD